ncbi:hypothetical protein TNCV_4941011 [Trichonephila clavipes]|nr:hypothetical protein TNCV_4941011 [Trichonephila clavipes]
MSDHSVLQKGQIVEDSVAGASVTEPSQLSGVFRVSKKRTTSARVTAELNQHLDSPVSIIRRYLHTQNIHGRATIPKSLVTDVNAKRCPFTGVKAASHEYVTRNFWSNFYSVAIKTASEQLFSSELKKVVPNKSCLKFQPMGFFGALRHKQDGGFDLVKHIRYGV